MGTSKKDIKYWEKELPEIAEETSMAERRAIDAEREVEDLKMAEYMVDKIGQEFDALITSITNFGMFVQVEEVVEGLVHISSIKDDYYEYNERGMILLGKRTGRQFRIGQKVRVKLINVDVDQYDIDFELVDEPEKEKKKPTKKDFEIREVEKTRKRRRRGRRQKRKKD